jgi:hypothetical protein
MSHCSECLRTGRPRSGSSSPDRVVEVKVKVKVKVKVTLRLTVSRMSWCQAQILGHLKRIPPPPSKLQFCLFGAPSLTRGRICHVSVFLIVSTIVYSIYMLHTMKITTT